MSFYTVYSPEGETPVRVQDETHKAAFSAAKRMAKAHPSQTFFVMKSASKPITAEVRAEEAQAA